MPAAAGGAVSRLLKPAQALKDVGAVNIRLTVTEDEKFTSELLEALWYAFEPEEVLFSSRV